MSTKTLGLIASLALTLAACGVPADTGTPTDTGASPRSDTPLLRVHSEGGFAPVELVLGRGPRYTLLEDGSLIYEGVQVAIYPGPLLPNYHVTLLDSDQMEEILQLVDDIGLAAIEHEIDDSASRRVADATTEVVTYWDDKGDHVYAAYALGIDMGAARPETVAFERLVDRLGELTTRGTDLGEYQPERVVIMAGAAVADPELEDVREWPLEVDLSGWQTLPNGWLCMVEDAGTLQLFSDATQTTRWRWIPPQEGGDAELFSMVVRPLHPGETGCPT